MKSKNPQSFLGGGFQIAHMRIGLVLATAFFERLLCDAGILRVWGLVVFRYREGKGVLRFFSTAQACSGSSAQEFDDRLLGLGDFQLVEVVQFFIERIDEHYGRIGMGHTLGG